MKTKLEIMDFEKIMKLIKGDFLAQPLDEITKRFLNMKKDKMVVDGFKYGGINDDQVYVILKWSKDEEDYGFFYLGTSTEFTF